MKPQVEHRDAMGQPDARGPRRSKNFSLGRAAVVAAFIGAILLAQAACGPPEPDIEIDPGGPYTGVVGEPIQFAGRYDGEEVTDYDWDFGDGSYSTGLSASHTYKDPGTYTVALIITDRLNNKDYAETTATISGQARVDPGGPYQGEIGKPIQFTGQYRDNDAVRHQWDFGDGSYASSLSVSHTYADPGTYTVGLTVTGAGDQEYSGETTATVSGQARVDPGGPYQGEAGKAIQFLGQYRDTNAKGYQWDFGDGTYATGLSASHMYKEPGTYTVALIVTVTGDFKHYAETTAMVTGHTVSTPLLPGCHPELPCPADGPVLEWTVASQTGASFSRAMGFESAGVRIEGDLQDTCTPKTGSAVSLRLNGEIRPAGTSQRGFSSVLSSGYVKERTKSVEIGDQQARLAWIAAKEVYEAAMRGETVDDCAITVRIDWNYQQAGISLRVRGFRTMGDAEAFVLDMAEKLQQSLAEAANPT